MPFLHYCTGDTDHRAPPLAEMPKLRGAIRPTRDQMKNVETTHVTPKDHDSVSDGLLVLFALLTGTGLAAPTSFLAVCAWLGLLTAAIGLALSVGEYSSRPSYSIGCSIDWERYQIDRADSWLSGQECASHLNIREAMARIGRYSFYFAAMSWTVLFIEASRNASWNRVCRIGALEWSLPIGAVVVLIAFLAGLGVGRRLYYCSSSLTSPSYGSRDPSPPAASPIVENRPASAQAQQDKLF